MKYKNHTKHDDGKQELMLHDMSWMDPLASKEESGKNMNQYGMLWMKLLTDIEEKGKSMNQYLEIQKLRKGSVLTPYGCEKYGLITIDPVGKSNYVKKSA
jgi:hypothetical protein